MVVSIFIRSDINLSVAPVRNPTFVTLSDGSIRNTYEVRLRNKHPEPRSFQLSVKGNPVFQIQLSEFDLNSVIVPADSLMLQKLHVIAPKDSIPAKLRTTELRIWVEDLKSGERVHKDTIFNGRTGK